MALANASIMLAEGSDHSTATNRDFIMVVLLFDIRITARTTTQDVSASQNKRAAFFKGKVHPIRIIYSPSYHCKPEFYDYPGYSFHIMKIKSHLGYQSSK